MPKPILIWILMLAALSSTAFAANSTSLISLPNTAVQQYSSSAQALFVIGVMISIFLILITFRIYNFYKVDHKYSLFDGIIGLVVGFIGVICLVFSLFFTTIASSPSYTVNATNTIMTIANQTIATLPLGTNASFALVADIFMFLDIILSFAYLFIIGIAYNIGRKERKYKGD